MNAQNGKDKPSIKIEATNIATGVDMSVAIYSDTQLTDAQEAFSSVLKHVGYTTESDVEVDYLSRFIYTKAELRGDDSYPAAYIDDRDTEWHERISVAGENKEDANKLAQRICYLLNKYGAE